MENGRFVGVSEPFFGYGSKTGLYLDIGFAKTYKYILS